MISKMRTEALEAAAVVERQFKENTGLLNHITEELRRLAPYSIVSIARGSSDHAAQYLNYLAMAKLGKLPTSLSMSILTLYQTQLDVSKSVGIAISQSGQSPDVVNPLKYFSEHAPASVALVNDITSPLASSAKWTVPLHAGAEKSVAATKSFIASLSASAHLVASWKKDQDLLEGLKALPEDLKTAQACDWTSAIPALKDAKRIMVVGRGFGLSLALEASLKFKETCSIQAEAFSAAEIKHGPQALIEHGYPLIVFANRGPALHSMLDLAADMKARGANVILAAPSFVKEKSLTIHSVKSEDLDILSAAQSFYLMIEELSRSLGLNPDEPRHLSKVTKTN
ncbi:SIS domain-containing protein [Bacteriovorax stolpii]|uniref:SIS domain-containing protein n=1 Tax=Bacteriovorax stolpii TaxID=960 RepID=UPI001C8E337C|nr:SIS domain-containing protein [Bacteriovorax stolpii]